MFKAVLFDLDGILVNSLPCYVKAYQDTLKELGFDFTEEQVIDTCFYKTGQQIIETLGINEKHDTYTKLYRHYKDLHFSQAPLFPEVGDILHFLKAKGIPAGVITLAERWYMVKMLSLYNLDHYFQSMVSADDVVNPKPDPESIEQSCAKLNVGPKEILMVGDSKGDIIMGQNAGSSTALFLPEENSRYTDFELLKSFNPTYAFSKFSELKNIVEMK